MGEMPRIPDPQQYIFTEGIDYLKTGKESIWGRGEQITVDLLKNYPISGTWMNLASGDGRYNDLLLAKASKIVATDIDESALEKLRFVAPESLKSKLETRAFNLTQPFPFDDNSFDGLFSTGTLHLFPPDLLAKIFREITRVVKPGGDIIIDFSTDIKRVMSDGRLVTDETEASYTVSEARDLLVNLLPNFKLEMQESRVSEEEVKTENINYMFSCNFLLATGKKSVKI